MRNFGGVQNYHFLDLIFPTKSFPQDTFICPVLQALFFKNFPLLTVFKSHWSHWTGTGMVYIAILEESC